MELIQWNVTNKCNLKCKHCRLGNNTTNNEIPLEVGMKLLRGAKRLKVRIFNLSGGEPFLRNDIFKIIDVASNYFEEVVITTNGTLITNSLAEKLSYYENLRLSVSLDGYGKEHDKFRGIEGVFKKVVENLKILRKNKVKFSIKFTISKVTSKPFKLIKLVKNLEAEYLTIRSVIPVGRADFSLMIDTPTYIKIIRKTLTLGKKLKVKILSDDPILIPLFPELIEETYESIKNLCSGCLTGSDIAYIDALGTVFPCAYIPIRAGNIKNSSLEKIVKTSKVFRLLKSYKERLKGKCGNCKYKYVCGGCRAVALAFYNDLLREDPRCMVK